MDGMEVLTQRAGLVEPMPVIVVSARTHEGDKVAALDLGADDYIDQALRDEWSCLPASARPSAIRARALTTSDRRSPWQVYASGDLTIDYDKHRVFHARARTCT